MHAQSELDLKPGNKHRPERYSRAIKKLYDKGFDDIAFPTQLKKRAERDARLAKESQKPA